MKRADLSAERLRNILSYSPDTGKFVWLSPSKYHKDLLWQEAGCEQSHNKKRYHAIKIDGLYHKRSRLAFLYMTGRHPQHQIDHISGDSLDDRWCNLREATTTENAWNHRGRKREHSDLPMGVCYSNSQTFRARISVNKKHLYLGTFKTPEEAHSVYLKAREKYYGRFSGL